MSPPSAVSVVVPTRNAERTIEACLRSIREQTEPRVECIVVDNGSDDATLEMAQRVADSVVTGGPERSAQRNQGAHLATGDLLLFIDADMVLDRTAVTEIVSYFDSRPEVGALVLPELAFGVGYLARSRALEKQLYLGDPNVEAPRAFRRDVFDAVGGFDEALFGGEDWDLADRLRSAGQAIGRVATPVHHDEGHIRLRTNFAKKRYYGTSLARYVRRDPPAGRRRLIRTSLVGQPGLLVRSWPVVPGLVLLKVVEGAGLALGLIEGRRSDG